MTNDFLNLMPKGVLSAVGEIDLNIPSTTCKKEINDLLQRTVLVGGKRLRPLLTHLVGDLFQLDTLVVAPYARAVELVHAASLSHDDVIDNATMRRGLPSINIVASNKKAVLAGDTLLSSVIVDLTEAGHLSLVREMSYVIRDLSEGEWIQADLILSRDYTKSSIREIAMKKTSSVMSYCCLAPAILKGFNPKMIENAREFGNCLGLAFQMIDDTLDYNEKSLKDQMLDLKNGIVNAVIFRHFELNPNLFKKFKSGEDLTELIKVEDLTLAINDVRNEAHCELEKANQLLLEIGEYLKKEFNLQLTEKSYLPLQTVISFIGLRQA